MENKTPYFVIHKKDLDINYNNLVNALKRYWNNYIIGYSYKTNALPYIIDHFNYLGCYAEVVSDDEFGLAKLIGVNNNRIIYNGPIKTKDTFLEAIHNHCVVNIDSQREIDWLDEIDSTDCQIGIRINFDIEKMCPGQSQCPEEGGRFGFCYENGELEKAINRINNKGIRISGLHLHTSSKSRSLDIYNAIAKTACKVKEEYHLNLRYIDIGGGFFGGLPNKPQFDDYIKFVSETLTKSFNFDETTLIVEPGMAVIGAPISYVTTVIDVKDTTYGRFVITDGTRMDIDPLMTKNTYFHSYMYQRTGEIILKQVICGSTCMEHDRLFTAYEEPELKVGDKIVYNKVGAYTMCLTPLFIKYFPDVYVEEDGMMELVREAWGPKEYIQKMRVG